MQARLSRLNRHLFPRPHSVLMPTDEPGQVPHGEETDRWAVSLVAQTVAPAEDAEQEEVVAALPY